MTNLTFQAREEVPFLKKFSNDWPTKALAMQLLKNKRGYSYRCGYLEVPERYSYLKDVATKRRPRGGGSKADNAREDAGDSGVVASGSKSKRAAPATAATQQPRKKKKTSTPDATTTKTRARPMANGKGKQNASSIGVEDKDEDEERTQDGEVDSEVDNESEDMVDQE